MANSDIAYYAYLFQELNAKSKVLEAVITDLVIYNRYVCLQWDAFIGSLKGNHDKYKVFKHKDAKDHDDKEASS